jgi:hypothetical protein
MGVYFNLGNWRKVYVLSSAIGWQSVLMGDVPDRHQSFSSQEGDPESWCEKVRWFSEFCARRGSCWTSRPQMLRRAADVGGDAVAVVAAPATHPAMPRQSAARAVAAVAAAGAAAVVAAVAAAVRQPITGRRPMQRRRALPAPAGTLCRALTATQSASLLRRTCCRELAFPARRTRAVPVTPVMPPR